MDGFLFIDKPQGPTSFDVVRNIRKALGIKKIGHNGTLDPAATGLLVLATGYATRLLPYLSSEPKEYTFTITFGKTTDTLDGAGVFSGLEKPAPSLTVLTQTLPFFIGDQNQQPPAFSAIKIQGTRAYTLARQNKTVSIPARKITINTLQLIRYNADTGEAVLSTQCSQGTYIRSLARDIAEKAGSIGYASSIRRTAINGFSLAHAVSIDDVRQNPQEHIHPVNEILQPFPSYHATPEQEQEIAFGRPITIENPEQARNVFIYSKGGDIIAVAQVHAPDRLYPIKVFIRP